MTSHRVPAQMVLPGAALTPGAVTPAASSPAAPSPGVGTPIPAPSTAEVERPRLDGAFHRLIAGEVRCVCVWAAAGSGKMTLLASWAGRLHRNGESVTWVRAQPGRFRPADVWRQVGRRSGVSGDGDTRYVFIGGLDRVEADRPGLVGEPVASAPEDIRLVVAGRTRPCARPTRLRGDGSMVDVPPADLAFDRSELLALAAGHRLLLTDEETTILLQRTAGWVTGLMLIVPFLHGRNDSARLVVDFDGDDPAVAGFLRSEIIDG